MSAPGNRAGLNLGPLLEAGGRWVGLNLGIDWWSEEPPEPPAQDLLASIALAWEPARSNRALTVVSWGRSEVARRSVSPAWERAEACSSAPLAVGWGLSSLLRQSDTLAWRGWQPLVRHSLSASWRTLGRCSVQLDSPWGRGGLTSCYTHLPWGQQAVVERGGAAGWAHRPTIRQRWQAPWQRPQERRHASRLPWGAAAKVPWIVRPPVIPPDPDPEPQRPPGARVGLNLGCPVVGGFGVVPLNLGVVACYAVRPQRRTYVVINTVSFVRLPDRTPIELTRISLSSSRSAWGWTFDFELADPGQLSLLKPTAAGPRQFEVVLNGYTWTGIVESFQKQREFADGGVRCSGRSRTALLAAPYAPAG